MNRIRTAGQFLAAASIAGMGVLGFASPAVASTNSVTIDNASTLTIKSSQTLSIASIAAAYCHAGLSTRSAVLSLQGPSGASSTTQTIKSSNSVPCNQDINLAATLPTPHRNGSYLVKMDSHGNEITATLDVLIAPARTSGLGVTSSGTTARFTWNANPEADITGYQILTSRGAVATAPDASACSGGSCSTSANLGSSVAGKTEKFTVRAVRCGLSCSDGVIGPSSATASTSFHKVKPSPSPTPTPTPTPTPDPTQSSGGTVNLGGGNGHHGGGGNGSNGGNSAGSKTHKKHGVSVNSGPLPSLHLPSFPNLQSKAKLLSKSDHAGSLPAPKVARTSTHKTRSTTQAISHDIATGLKLPPLWRGIAAASILLLIAVHLRAWAARVDLT